MEYADDRKIQPDRITYRLIQEYIEEKYGFKVHTANIAEVKRNLGLPMYDAPNAVEELKRPYKPAPEYKVEATSFGAAGTAAPQAPATPKPNFGAFFGAPTPGAGGAGSEDVPF